MFRQQIIYGIRHLLSEQDANPFSKTYGCFDRRYWGWKLVDYAEATFQRAVYPLAWAYTHLPDVFAKDLLFNRIRAGLLFAVHVQHKNGSFDQAFPYEQSFGATAFLLHPLCYAYTTIADDLPPAEQLQFLDMIRRGADFLTLHNEAHAHIANHLAGAALSLLVCADLFDDVTYQQAAIGILDQILERQSDEGWFVEYEGADPGYQTLCVYYLAQVQQRYANDALDAALEKAITFLAWCVHPDGTMGGEYGSRRTAIFYPGGIALLSDRLPLANSILTYMSQSIADGKTTTLHDIDMGNFVPLLSSYVLAMDTSAADDTPPLPFMTEQDYDFPEAGFYFRQSGDLYAVIGASNGGVIKLFDKKSAEIIFNDSGYVVTLTNGKQYSSQSTDLTRPCTVTDQTISIDVPFNVMDIVPPSPFQMVVLRILNLTVMRHIGIGNLIKRLLVWLLISKKDSISLRLSRTINVNTDGIEVFDQILNVDQNNIKSIQHGIGFSSIHMASANYYYGSYRDQPPQTLTTEQLKLERKVFPVDG